MNKKVFVDTGAFLALTNVADQYHQKAIDCLERLRATGAGLLTTNFVLDETYTRLRKKAGLKVAIQFGEGIQASAAIKVYTVDAAIEKQAWRIFKKYHDQVFSYTDCTSFAFMNRKKVKEAFCFDKDFRIFGFLTHPLSSHE